MEPNTELWNPETCLGKLRELFQEADADGDKRTCPALTWLTTASYVAGSGGVDQAELAVLLSKFYREQKMARPPARVKAEVVEAMEEFDEDQNGTLEVRAPVTHGPRFAISRTPMRATRSCSDNGVTSLEPASYFAVFSHRRNASRSSANSRRCAWRAQPSNFPCHRRWLPVIPLQRMLAPLLTHLIATDEDSGLGAPRLRCRIKCCQCRIKARCWGSRRGP